MYDVGCTMYDLRFGNLASLRLAKLRSVGGGGGLGVAGGWFERGGAPGGAYVRFTI